jgi:hypothetical protein
MAKLLDLPTEVLAMIVELLFAESTVRRKWESSHPRSVFNPFALFRTCSMLHNDKLLRQVAWRNTTLEIAPYAISKRTRRAPPFMSSEDAAMVRTVVLDFPIVLKEELDNVAHLFPSLTKFVLLPGTNYTVSFSQNDSKMEAAFRACLASKTGIQVCPLELTHNHLSRASVLTDTIRDVWSFDHFSERGFIAVVDFFPCSLTARRTCGCLGPIDIHHQHRSRLHQTLRASFHLSLTFLHTSHEDFSLWQSEMSTSSVGMLVKRHRDFGWVYFSNIPSSPPEIKEHAAQMSGEESGVQAVLQKQIVKPLYRW